MQLPFPEPEESSSALAPPPVAVGRRTLFSRPLAVLLLGVALIGAAALAETALLRNQSWKDALLVPEGALPEHSAGLIPISVRRLPLDLPASVRPLLDQLRALPDVTELTDLLHLDKGERVVSLSMPAATLTPLLASGKLPAPGKLEALAGDLASRDAFDLDGATFFVVGRLQRGVNALAYAYVVLESEGLQQYFTPASGATSGWIDPEGLNRLEGDETHLAGEDSPKAVAGFTRSVSWIAGLTFAGLILVAGAGSFLQVRFLRYSASRTAGSLGAVLRELDARPGLFASMHVLLYGVFFLMMLLAFAYPVANIRAALLVRDAFLKGDLSYIGDAYASGDILRATAATFVQNYFVATILFTLLPSLVIPFVGVLKNLLSFAVVGFVMAPLWTGSAPQLAYHCITMTLEMEAYIVASFVVIVFPLRVFKGLTATGRGEIFQGIRIVASGALLAGIMLAIAALYEATTLIILSPLR